MAQGEKKLLNMEYKEQAAAEAHLREKALIELRYVKDYEKESKKLKVICLKNFKISFKF